MRVAPTFTELIVGLWDSMEGEKYENCGKRFERVEKEAPKELITAPAQCKSLDLQRSSFGSR